MRKIYYDIKNTSSFGGKRKLIKQFPKQKVNEWVQNEMTYSLHKPIRKRFETRTYHCAGLNDTWQIDLMEMIPYSSINKGYKYIVVCIDIFSRYVRALPAKNKSGSEISEKIKCMLEETPKVPKYIQTDFGKEFYNSTVKELFKKFKINHYTVDSQFKASLIERFNRTLREKLNRYFTYTGTKIWYHVLNDIVATYNNTEHKALFGLSPISITEENEFDIWMRRDNMEEKKKERKRTFTIKNNDYVRISKISVSNPFIKNFNQNWTEEIFRVKGIDDSLHPRMYILEDMKGEEIKGKFYHEELQYIGQERPKTYRIEKVLQTRGKGTYKQYLVKWHGYDSRYNTWIKASDIENNEKRFSRGRRRRKV